MARKPLSKKIRFEVFKRDNFKCQYCGRSAPDVVLHVDHIKPVAEGGTGDISNLVTACIDCNLGKGANLLDDKSVIEKQRKQLEELNERREQLEMMMQWREGLMKLDEDKLLYAKEKFETSAKCALTDTGVRELRSIVRKYPFDQVLDSIEAATMQYLVVEKDGQSFTKESVSKAFDFIGKIAAIKTKTQEKPYMKELFYVRGILRNRLHYCNQSLAINYLEGAYLQGYSIEVLKDFALSVKSWASFKEVMEKCLESGGDADA